MLKKTVGEGVTPSGTPSETSEMKAKEKKILKEYEEKGREAGRSSDPKEAVRKTYPRSEGKGMDKETRKALEDLKEAYKKGYREK